MVGINGLPALMLSGNFPEEIVFQWNTAFVSIYMNGKLLLEEEYEHAGNYLITLRLRELLDSQLKTIIPLAGDIVEQSESVADFEIHVPEQAGTGIYPFRLVKGGIDSEMIDSTTFLRGNFLTWMPRVKKVKFLDPQWLTYYAIGEARLFIQATYLEADDLITSDPALLYELPYGKKSTLNVKFQRLWEQFAQESRSPYYIDCWIEDEGKDVLTYKQRYVLTDQFHEFDDLFCFENSLGGVDVIRFTGEIEHKINHEFKSAQFLESTQEYGISFLQLYEKSTGYFKNGYEMLWTNDFLSSINRCHYVAGIPVGIVLKGFEAKSIKTALNHYVFSFAYSKQSKYLNHQLIIDQLPGIAGEYPGMSSFLDDIYVRIFGDQAVDGVKTFLQPVKTNEVKPASGDNLVLNDLVVQEGGIIDCGEF
jgi:hypothetical protein